MSDNVAHAIAGAGGGALASIVSYPLITLSTRAQTEVLHADTSKKGSIIAAARDIVKREGISGLYAGLESAMYGMTVTNFVYYYFYEGIKSIYLENTPTLTTTHAIIAGAASGAATTLLTNPIWVVNTRQMVRETGDASTLSTIRSIYAQDGLTAFFSGVAPALLLVINPVLNYSIFERLRAELERRRKMTAIDAFFLGAIGKVVATTVTYPIITLKSRLQLRQTEKKSLLQNLKESLAREGFFGLYKGWNAKVLQSALQSAFLFFFKEQLFALALIVLGLLRKIRTK